MVDLGESIYENAALPEKYWNPKEGKYNNSPIKMPGMVAGVSDGAIDEVTEKMQFIKLGLDVATNPEIITNTFNKIRKLKWEDVKKGVKNIVQSKIDKYANGGPIAYHEGGKDAVVVAAIIWGGSLVEDLKKNDTNLDNELEDEIKKQADEVVEMVGKYDWNLVRRYFKYIQTVTGR